MAAVEILNALAKVDKRRLRRPWFYAMAVAALAAISPGQPAGAENAEIAHRRATERKTFTDAEIIDGFFKIAFGAELRFADGVDRIRKFDGPVRVYIDNKAKPDRSAEVVSAISEIGSRIRDLDIARVNRRELANVMLFLVHDRDRARTIRALYGASRARRIQRSLEPQCLSGFRKDSGSRVVRSDVILVANAGDLVFYNCLYEELLQALGPINDDSTVPHTMFNDDVEMGFFDVYDQYLLNILYHPRIRPGMTREQVKAVLPEVLPAVRAWVAMVNGLLP